jgi:uncharacterized protein (TIGR02145 family)
MNFRKIIFAALIVSAAAGCKKKDADAALTPSLDGYMTIQGLPEYVKGGQSVTLTPKGVSHPDGKELTYTWRVTPSAPTACSTKVFNFTFTDTLQTCTIYCTASAEGYSSSAAVNYATVVKGGADGSIKGLEFPTTGISTSDTTTYYFKQIGTQTWMLNNVAEKPAGKAYGNADVMSNVYGRYYSYLEAISVCKSLSTSGYEWKLPSLDDWKTLEAYVKEQPNHGKSLAAALMGDATFNGKIMWEYWPQVGDITNSTGFSAIPVGYTNIETSLFEGENEYAVFWTDTEADKANEAHAIYLIEGQPELFISQMDKQSFGASVRCIRK